MSYEERIAVALEKLVERGDRHSDALCTRCKNRCSSCDKSLPVLPELPEMWEKAIERLITIYELPISIEGIREEFEVLAAANGYEKCTHGLWVTQEFLKANPHRRRG